MTDLNSALLSRLKEDLEGMGVEVCQHDDMLTLCAHPWMILTDGRYFFIVAYDGRRTGLRIVPGVSYEIFQYIKEGHDGS